ncbi:hypothetical protein ACS0TY_033954 [Phlomoides rotata]
MIMLGHLLHHPSPLLPISKPSPKLNCINKYDYEQKLYSITNSTSKSTIWSKNLISLAIAVAIIAPLPSSAIPFPNAKSSPVPSTTTPFSQAQNLPTGLENGKIRPCPSINPGCVSSNPMSSSFAFPWRIVGYSSNSSAMQVSCFSAPVLSISGLTNTPTTLLYQKLQDALVKTQKNVKIQIVEDTPRGQYLQAEVDGGFGRDVLEFLINGDVVSFRGMATKVTYVYPFTTALGDSKGQEGRLKQIINELGWYAPSFDDSMDMLD